MLLLAFASPRAGAGTQVGSAPYKASSTAAGNSYAPVFSADGRHVAFVSHANNLVTNDDLGPHLDLFLRDLVASNTVLVSVSSKGFGGANDSIGLYTLSSNAQVIAFDTAANNLAAGDGNRVSDIYVRNLVSGATRLITPGANGPSSNPLISEDGQRIIFESLASNLVTNDFNGTNDIFIHDLMTGVTELVSVNADGTASPDGASHSPSISADGLTVAFISHATNLVAGVTNTLGEVYVRSVMAHSTRWATASHLAVTRPDTLPNGFPTGLIGPYVASEPMLSADGSFVAFKTVGRTVRFDLQRPTNQVLEFFPPSPVQGAMSNYFLFYDNPRLSASASAAPIWFSRDGRFLAYTTRTNFVEKSAALLRVDFESYATNAVYFQAEGASGNRWGTNQTVAARTVLTNAPFLSPDQEKGWTQMPWLAAGRDPSRLLVLAESTNFVTGVLSTGLQIYSVDVDSAVIQLISTNGSGGPGPNLDGIVPAASLDGSLVAWESQDDRVVAGDLNRSWDVFVRHLETGETQVISTPHQALATRTGVAVSKLGGEQSISGDGSQIIVISRDGDLVSGDTNQLADPVLRDLQTGLNTMVSGPFLSLGDPGSAVFGEVQPTNEVSIAAISASGRQIIYSGRQYDAIFSRLFGPTNLYWRDLGLDTNWHVVAPLDGKSAISMDGRLVGFQRVYDFGSTNPAGLYLLDCRNLPPTEHLVSLRRDSTDQGANALSINPSFSPDSRWIVFQSLATDLTYDSDAFDGYQLYARQIDTGFIKRVSYLGAEGTNVFALPGGAADPSFSADARYVFFDGITDRNIYRHDLPNDMNDAGTERRPNLIVCSNCANPTASSEGRYVAYESRPELGGVTNIFLKDIVGGAVELISVSMSGTNGNGSSFTPWLSHDARFVVFASKASDLVLGDNNRATDIFVRDRFAGVTHCLSRNLAGTGSGNRVSSNPILSADGRTVAFQSFAGDLVPGDYNDTRDVFVVTLGGPDTDGDGMEDDWEVGYFNTLDRDGSGDFDHDGLSDRDEFRAGTNPANDASILRVLRLATGVAAGPEAARTTVILWSATPGKTYRVESKVDLEADWDSIGADVVASTVSASVVHVTGSVGEATGHRFYRVMLVQ